MFHALLSPFVSLLYPQPCRICADMVDDRYDGIICSRCWSKTKIFSAFETLCSKCGAFLSEAEPLFETFCHRCDEHFYNRARSLGSYTGGIAASIIELKTVPHLPERLAREMKNLFLHTFCEETTLIIPVPLSKDRLRERGFNQAAVIARAITRNMDITTDEKSLTRQVHTPIHRAAMDKKAREASVANAFTVTRPKLIEGQVVLLVDDVLTSGATASNCAKALKKCGAAAVNVLTLGRASLR